MTSEQHGASASGAAAPEAALGSVGVSQTPNADHPTWKTEANLIARAALAGVRVTRSATDNGRPEWIASRWALTRAFSSLDELRTWLARVTGRVAS